VRCFEPPFVSLTKVTLMSFLSESFNQVVEDRGTRLGEGARGGHRLGEGETEGTSQ
jgi:hypothetical protein